MGWTQADLEAINTAIATGAKRVRFQTHEVEYQSVNDLLKVRAIIIAALTPSTGGGAYYAEYDGGY